MKKEVTLLLAFMIISLFLLTFVKANNLESNIKVDKNNYTIEMVSENTFKITNDTYTTTYQFSEAGMSTQKAGLYLTLTYSYNGPWWMNATLLILHEEKFSYISQPGDLCYNECNLTDGTVCIDDSSYKTCGNFDLDSCYEWGNFEDCDNGETCENGMCSAPGEIRCNDNDDCLIEDTDMP